MLSDAKPRVFFLFHGRFPSEKAAAIFQDAEAASFAELGHEVIVIAPNRLGRTHDSVSTKYRALYVPTIDLVPLHLFQSLAFRLSLLCFSISAFIALLARAQKDDVIISNEALPLFFASMWYRNTLFEMHDYPERSLFLYRALFARAGHILVTNKWKLEKFATDFPGAAHKAFHEPNAVDVAKFSIPLSREEARKKLNLPLDRKSAVYTGHLYSWKGVDTLADAAKLLSDVDVYVVGGTDEDVARYKEKYGDINNLHVVGRRPHDEMPLWQKAADVLVLPNTAKEEISAHYTSPMKLFEYMASGTPIVASDIPSIRELGQGLVSLVIPDDPAALSGGVQVVLRESRDSPHAVEWVSEHTWKKRAGRIKEKIQRRF